MVDQGWEVCFGKAPGPLLVFNTPSGGRASHEPAGHRVPLHHIYSRLLSAWCDLCTSRPQLAGDLKPSLRTMASKWRLGLGETCYHFLHPMSGVTVHKRIANEFPDTPRADTPRSG